MAPNTAWLRPLWIAAIALLASCGGGSTSDSKSAPATSPAPTSSTAPPPATTPPPGAPDTPVGAAGTTTTITTSPIALPFTGTIDVFQPAGYALSAGVYDTQGNLVRTLTSVQPGIVQTSIKWDGKDDAGNPLAPGNYQIKVLTNNVKYTWEGGLGDSSTEPLTDTRLTGNDYTTMVTVGAYAFLSAGYSEHSTAERVVSLSDINKVIPFTGDNTTTMNMGSMATDGNIVYIAGDKWGDDASNGTDGITYQSWVIGTYPADMSNPNKFIPFPARVTATSRTGSGHFDDGNAIAYSNDTRSYIANISVQKTGNGLFVSRPSLNQLQVLDKRATSGAVLQTLVIPGIGEVAADASSSLYALVGGQIVKYAVNADATLTDTNTRFSGISNASRIAYSGFLDRVAVFDNTTFQIKIYSPAGGAAVQVIGIAGGYAVSPYVDHARFADANFVYYQQDGSLWIGQPSLHSVLHYNLDFTIREVTEHLPTSRATTADQNNPTRIFSNYNEFARDYSKPLDNGKNGSWKLTADWAKGLVIGSNYDGIIWDCTLSNGRNYALVYSGGRKQLSELTPTGIRLITDFFSGEIGRDGTLIQYGDNNSNGKQPTGMYKRQLTGFDSSNNPVWSDAVLWIPNPPSSNYVPWRGYQNRTSGLTDSADGYIYFETGEGLPLPPGDTTVGYRLGKVSASTGQPVWKTARTTNYDYSGPYPVNGDFDTGNNNGYYPQHSETHAQVYDNNIFWNVNGEFWQDTEANHWNHVDAATGLLINHFGTDGNLSRFVAGRPGMAGNAFSVATVKVGDDLYIYHCDESVHALVHSWKVSGLNTIKVTTVSITLTDPVVLPSDPADLMAGVPFRASSFMGGSGWTMNPSVGIDDAPLNPYPTWRVYTTKNAYREDDNDIYMVSDGNASGSYRTVTRALGTNNLANWTLTGAFKLNSNLNDNYSLNVIDSAGKVLVQIKTKYNRFYLNGSFYYELQQDANIASYKFIPFVVDNVNGQLVVKINDYLTQNVTPFEGGGNVSAPANFQIRAGGTNDQQHTMLSIKNLRFATGAQR